MKNFSRAISTILATVFLLISAGCASSGTHIVSKAGDTSLLGEPGIRVDRLVTKSAHAEGTLLENDVIQVVLKNPDGTTRMVADGKGGFQPDIQVSIKERLSNPVGNDMAKSLAPVGLGGLLQYQTAIDTAKQSGKNCQNGGCGGAPIVVNAVAGSSSGAVVDVDVKTGTSGTCATCGFKPK